MREGQFAETDVIEPVQFALQIQVNSGSASAYWAFDDEWEVHDHPALAWDDMDAAEDEGYRASDLRVVAISVLPEPSSPTGQAGGGA